MIKTWIVAVASTVFMTTAFADVNVPMNLTDKAGSGKLVGTIQIHQTEKGLLFTPDLKGLTPGLHGFHVHQNPACGDTGMAAGGHLDPKKTDKHLGPYHADGHMGDLPALFVAPDGTATKPVLAPRLKSLKDVKNHTLMVHAGGDNYSDTPAKLGGGGARIICGVVK